MKGKKVGAIFCNAKLIEIETIRREIFIKGRREARQKSKGRWEAHPCLLRSHMHVVGPNSVGQTHDVE